MFQTPSARDKGLSQLQRLNFPSPSGRVTFLALLPGKSHSSPGSLLFDPEIERTLRRTSKPGVEPNLRNWH
ncbi:hypothetical protein PIB30_037829 [Stylosanthes scabra]|uniref:Uncharacterized protein n=1 Tax=Stylosanthes scabra TaxID=79078 RepID=A0ABU6REJ1_9FABA|nr:hypothetical protein [Stylosanthes scabra]